MTSVGSGWSAREALCPSCGAELDPYISGGCPSCGADRSAQEPSLAPGDEYVAYDLSFEEPLDRVAVGGLLSQAAVPYRWAPGLELRVGVSFEARVDQIFDQLAEIPDDLPTPDDDAVSYGEIPAGDAPDEIAVDALARLFDAADRLAHRPTSHAGRKELDAVAAVIQASAAPRGFGPGWWGDLHDLVEQLTVMVAREPDDDKVKRVARQLRDLLRDHV